MMKKAFEIVDLTVEESKREIGGGSSSSGGSEE